MGGGPVVPRLTKCAMQYMVALADPFNRLAVGACVPHGVASSASERVTGVIRMTGTVGSAGHLFIWVLPCIASNSIQVITSTGGAILSAANALNTGTNIARIAGLPFSATQLQDLNGRENPQVQGRIVAAAVRWKYTGTELNRGGSCYALFPPEHRNVCMVPSMSYAHATIDSVAADPSTSNVPVTDKWTTRTLWGSTAPELAYGDPSTTADTELFYPYSESSGLSGPSNALGYQDATALAGAEIGAPVGVVAITSTAGNTFAIEYIIHAEFIGAQAYRTVQSDTDMEGGIQVARAAGNTLRTLVNNGARDLWSGMVENLREQAAMGMKYAVPAVINGLASIL